MRHRSWLACAVCLVLAWTAACRGSGNGPAGDVDPALRPYVGTWERITGTSSKIALRPAADGLAFRWALVVGKREVRCEKDDVCLEYHEDEPIYEWRFRVFTPSGSTAVHVERSGHALGTAGGTPLTEVDRLDLQPGGQELWAVTVERNGQTLDPPGGPYKFRKLSDEPF